MSGKTVDPSNALILKRILTASQAVAKVECAPGKITVIQDEIGASLKAYQQVLSGRPCEERFAIELGGGEINLSQQSQVGFEERLPEGKSIIQFFEGLGVSPDKINQTIDHYELRKHLYLNCAQLAPTQARQLLLLEACSRQTPVIVLNDPFLPFNGRWREAFAELVLNEVRNHQRIVVIINLSFIPKCWEKSGEVTFVDVGRIAERAASSAKEAAREQAEVAKAVKQAERDDNPYYGRKISFVLPESITFAFKETADFIFEPLARVARFVRSWSGALAVSSFAVLVLVMGFVMFPHIAQKQALLHEISQKLHYSWKDFLPNSQSPEQSPAPQEPAETMSKETNEVLAEVENPEVQALLEDPAINPYSLSAEENEILEFRFSEGGGDWQWSKELEDFMQQPFGICLEETANLNSWNDAKQGLQGNPLTACVYALEGGILNDDNQNTVPPEA